eukprot:CAMPEP_0202695266 /NCGR_PEP_ID=MMETSP1385-20130828/8905_1 /ASSEMBLY_ACC=CAM_ASM_000861 /TAXON_ID=933848 /ORGANISM="Elphidium margaritaceum" /LENGTH=622 /DNA_ID=CAMNT_0049351265 /DNA_START=36 /DNA_END=1904 /DNA_ORIENTATION=-
MSSRFTHTTFSSSFGSANALLDALENPIHASKLSTPSCLSPSATSAAESVETEETLPSPCYFGDRNSRDLQFFFGRNLPLCVDICRNGLISYGQQTQMHCLSFLWRYPYLHPVAMVYALLFLWCIDFRVRLLSIACVLLIVFTVAESLKIERHASMQSFKDKVHMSAQLVGDLFLIPYQCLVCPSERPLIQFQNTTLNRYLFANCRSLWKYTPTFWMRNIWMQFMFIVCEEQYASSAHLKIYREALQTDDGGLVALDWWVDPQQQAEDEEDDDNKEQEEEEEMASCGTRYTSKRYYAYNKARMDRLHRMAPYGDRTPIFFVFTTYCGDSMSMPVRKLAQYFCARGWRVVCYVKRGCGSPYYEMLPLTTHRPFDLSGMDDAEFVAKTVADRYPDAKKVCVGISLGGSQAQDFLVTANLKRKYFDAGIKIDGIDQWTQLIGFGIRQNIISKVLGEVVHDTYVKSLFMKNTTSESDDAAAARIIDSEKVDAWKRKTQCDGLDFDRIAAMKSADCEILDVVKAMMGPIAGHDDAVTYLHASGPEDISRVNVPLLVFNTWNDGFQDPFDNPVGIANVNPYVMHCVTKGGTHCIRREGWHHRDCWLSKTCFEFANAVVNASAKLETPQ